MSARRRTPSATSARYWTKEAKPARKATRQARRREDAAALRDIVAGRRDAAGVAFSADKGTQGRLTH